MRNHNTISSAALPTQPREGTLIFSVQSVPAVIGVAEVHKPAISLKEKLVQNSVLKEDKLGK